MVRNVRRLDRVRMARQQVTDFDLLMKLREQKLRTRVMHLEHAIRRYLDEGDRERLLAAYSNEWVKPLGGSDE